MSYQTVKIRDKSVQLSQPYLTPVAEIVGRESEMRRVLAAWMGGPGHLPLSPLLLGEPGLGKNRIIYECSKMCSKELYIFQGHEDVTAEDLICSARFSDDPDKKMDYIVSPLVSAMLHGGVCFIDEIAKIRRRALAPLASLLDERRYIDSVLLGERVHAHPGFRFVAATNTDDLDENPLPDFIKSRLRPVISVAYPHRKEIERIIKSRYQAMNGDGAVLLERFWDLWKVASGERPPTPRDSLYLFGYALNLTDFEEVEQHQPYDLEYRCGSPVLRVEHLEQAFEAFKDSMGSTGHAQSTDSSPLPQ